MASKKRKAVTVAGAVALTGALLLGGTFAWQSISQIALNENRASINPGARLHDDYHGTNGIKRVYVENFANDDVSIIARVRLDEYMEIGGSAGYKTKTETANGNYIEAGTNGVIRLIEEDTSTAGSVIIKVEPIPYTGYTVDTVTVNTNPVANATANLDGTYSYTATAGTSVTIKATFKTGTATGDTVSPARSLVTGADVNDVTTWTTYVPKTDSTGAFVNDTTSAFRNYVTLTLGSKTDVSYMPTFNKNKDSLKADVNGTYEGKGTGTPYDDYVDYSLTVNQSKTADAVYDNDYNTVDEENPQVNLNITKETETHEAKTISASKSTVISMKQWINEYDKALGDYWIYDADGWAYWGNLLEAEDEENVTGLLLSGNQMTGTPEDNWYYGMNVVAQFVTPGDLGKDDTTGFYTNADEAPTADAELLLSLLGAGNEISTSEGTIENGVLTVDSGTTATLSVKDPGASKKTGATTNKWTILNAETEDGIEIISLTEKSDGTAEVTAIHPGEAYVVYRSETALAMMKVKVDYATYTITSDTDVMADAAEKGIISYTDASKEAELVIAGYYPAKEASDYSSQKVYYQVEIGEAAFQANMKITNLVIEEGVSAIGGVAFYNCKNLTGELTIPGSVKKIDGSAFADANLTKVVLKEGIEYMAHMVFRRNTNLQSINIPYSLKTLGGGAFYGDTMLTDVQIPEDHQYYCLQDDVVYTKDMRRIVWLMDKSEKTFFEIPDSVEIIGYAAFRTNATLQTVVIPKSVKTIQGYAFAACDNLNAIQYAGSLEEWNAISIETTWAGSSGDWILGKINYDYVAPTITTE